MNRSFAHTFFIFFVLLVFVQCKSKHELPAGDPGNGDRDQRRGQVTVGEAEINRLPTDGDQRADNPVADQLGEGLASFRVGEHALDMASHLRSRASTDALAMAIGFTRAFGMRRTAARRSIHDKSPPISSCRLAGTLASLIDFEMRFCPALLA